MLTTSLLYCSGASLRAASHGLCTTNTTTNITSTTITINAATIPMMIPTMTPGDKPSLSESLLLEVVGLSGTEMADDSVLVTGGEVKVEAVDGSTSPHLEGRNALGLSQYCLGWSINILFMCTQGGHWVSNKTDTDVVCVLYELMMAMVVLKNCTAGHVGQSVVTV